MIFVAINVIITIVALVVSVVLCAICFLVIIVAICVCCAIVEQKKTGEGKKDIKVLIQFILGGGEGVWLPMFLLKL